MKNLNLGQMVGIIIQLELSCIVDLSAIAYRCSCSIIYARDVVELCGYQSGGETMGSADEGTVVGPGAGIITIDDFKQVDLRVAEVLFCEKVAGSDKLLRIEVSFGDEKRQIVAGIARYYEPSQMVGKKIIIVHNLKPAVIRGTESNGMLLAAKDGETLAVLTVDRPVANGSRIS